MAKAPSPAQLKARAKFTAMVRAKSAAKKKAPVKRKAPVKKRVAKNPIIIKSVVKPQKYVVKVVTFKGQVGYLTPHDTLDTEHAKASKLAKANAEKKAYELFGKFKKYLHTIEVVNVKKPNGAVYKRNPVPASLSLQEKEAAYLFEDFTGHKAEYSDKVKLPSIKTALQVGECDGIMYTTVRDGKTECYVHKFKKSARPALAASFDGKHLLLLGGNYNFTNRGIVDN